MPKKGNLHITQSEKSENEFINPFLKNRILKNRTPDPITEFKIDDQLYLVFSVNKENEKLFSHKYAYINSINCKVVGEMKIHKKRSTVVQPEDFCSKDNSDEKKKNSMDILTRRELQIVMLVAEGRVNKQIADQLNISEWTVSTHLRRIFAKLGVDSRAAMIYRCSKELNELKK